MRKKQICLVSWNVNGIRACSSKGRLNSVLKLQPDVIFFQETKADPITVAAICRQEFPHYTLHSSSAIRKGYSGVATLVNQAAVRIDNFEDSLPADIFTESEQSLLADFRAEGRFSVLRCPDLTAVNVYIPSGTSGDHRQSLKYRFLDLFLKFLIHERKTQANIIIGGDFNICHQEIDIHHPQMATRNCLTGFLPEERAWVSSVLNSGFVDCYRKINGDLPGIYSWWSYRAQSRKKNLGWRIDYFLCSTGLSHNLKTAGIHTEFSGSDHCPVSVSFSLQTNPQAAPKG